MERRRADLLVTVPGSARPPPPAARVAVDIVQLTLRRGQSAALEAHWHIVDTKSGNESAGADTFSAALGSSDYADVARAISEDLGQLADRLAAGLRRN
jgi:uncharacterized lipoprotein YmbA